MTPNLIKYFQDGRIQEEVQFNGKWCYKFQHPKAPNGILIAAHKDKEVAKLLIMQKIKQLLND